VRKVGQATATRPLSVRIPANRACPPRRGACKDNNEYRYLYLQSRCISAVAARAMTPVKLIKAIEYCTSTYDVPRTPARVQVHYCVIDRNETHHELQVAPPP
jgi:hypothetical protein